MKKLKSLIISSFLIITVMTLPFVSFANNDKGEKDNGFYGKSRIEQKSDIKVSKNSHSSIWSRMFGKWFGKKANASVKTKAELTPNISGIKAPTVLKIGETGTWTVKASDPENGSLEYSVDWGDTNPQTTLKSMQEAFVQTSTFTHAYANAGTYNITFTVKNDADLKTTSSTTVHITNKDGQQAPVISNFTGTSDKPHQAVLKWNTDVRSTSLVWYSKTSPVDTSGKPNTANRILRVKNHKMTLNKLEPNTTYYVIVGSANGSGMGKSSEISFTTPKLPDSTNPVITKLEGSTKINVGETETVTVYAYDPGNDSLSYSADWGDSSPSMKSMLTPEPAFVQTTTFSHTYVHPGTYTATFTAENSSGKKASSSMTITVTEDDTDTADPVITEVGSNTGSTASTITWTTDEPATSKVYYSIGTPVDINSASSVSSASLVISHSLNISGLSTSTLYHFVVESTDASGNTATSAESSFTTSS